MLFASLSPPAVLKMCAMTACSGWGLAACSQGSQGEHVMDGATCSTAQSVQRSLQPVQCFMHNARLHTVMCAPRILCIALPMHIMASALPLAGQTTQSSSGPARQASMHLVYTVCGMDSMPQLRVLNVQFMPCHTSRM